jgi:hypothetical protein
MKMKQDLDQYMQYFDGLDLTHLQKMELLQELWNVIEMFVDLGFGVEATQYVLELNQMNPSKQAKDSLRFKPNQNTINVKGDKSYEKPSNKPTP